MNPNTDWKFIAPISGEYEVNAKIVGDGGLANQSIVIQIHVNGTYVEYKKDSPSGNGNYGANPNIISSFKLLKGDYIQVLVQAESTFNLQTDEKYNSITIKRVGNY